jgi:hypothetical protein
MALASPEEKFLAKRSSAGFSSEKKSWTFVFII